MSESRIPQRDPIATSATLLVRLKSTDKEPREIAWRDFYMRYAPVIAGFARNLHAPSTDIDDVIQEVLLGFYAKSPSFVYDPAKGRFRGYLKVCTVRALLKRLGQNAKFQGKALEDVDPASPDLDDRWNHEWEQHQLQRALDAVRQDYGGNSTFRAFEQYVILGKSVQDVSEQLGISPDSVYQAKTRITEALRRKVKELEEEEG